MLTQLDTLFGMDGSIQDTLKPSFVAAVDKLAAQAAEQSQKKASRKPLNLASAEPTFTQRLAGQRG